MWAGDCNLYSSIQKINIPDAQFRYINFISLRKKKAIWKISLHYALSNAITCASLNSNKGE